MRWRRRADELWAAEPLACRLRAARRDPSFDPVLSLPSVAGGRRVELYATPELAAISANVLGAAVVVPWEVGGGAGPRSYAHGAWRACEVAACERKAWRAWVTLGGHRAMAAEAERVARLRHAQLVSAIEAARAASMSQTERSGMASWIRGAEAALAGRRGGRGMQVQRRKLHEAMMAGGMRQDGRGRHAVAQVVQWRGGHRDREALVQWEGFDTSEEGGGAAWEDQWLPRACLTADLREGGRLRPYARRKRKADVAADVVAAAGGSAQGARRSARRGRRRARERRRRARGGVRPGRDVARGPARVRAGGD